jgi:asparagine synthase (glutamine-hydrolysing)
VVITKTHLTEASCEDWVLPLSLEEPSRVMPSRLRWADRGPFRGFFHGLLFDREDLADSANYGKRDCSEVDLILKAYERWGEAAFSRFRGSFIAAVLDRTRDVAFVARDPAGSHPLFYAVTNSRILFAASPQPLLHQPGVSRALNRAAIADHLCERWPDPHETFFTAVRRVPPGWRAAIAGGHLRLDRYWDPLPQDQPIQWVTDEEATRFNEVFDRAVDRCMRSGPTGIFLSGGLDSIAVAAVARDRAQGIGQQPPLALSLRFPDPECDEGARQTAVARHLGLRQHIVDFDEAVGCRPLFQQVLELNREMNAPIMWAWCPPYLDLARRAKADGVQTILTGEGGDEWLSVTPYLSADLMRRAAFADLSHLYSTFRRSYQLSTVMLARNVLWKFGLRPLVGAAVHRLMPEGFRSIRTRRSLAGDPAWISQDPALRAEQRRRVEGSLMRFDPPQGFYLEELRKSLDHSFTSWDAEERHELGKKFGVRFAHPFWDPDLVELLYRMPPRILNGGGRSKSIVRETLARRFPALGLGQQRKIDGTSFFKSIINREAQALAKVGADFPSLSALGVVDGRATRNYLLKEVRNPGRGFHQIFHIVNLEMWVRSQEQQRSKKGNETWLRTRM